MNMTTDKIPDNGTKDGAASDSSATKITIHRADGSVWQAEGKAAEEVDKWWTSLEQFAFLHNMNYSGPCLKRVVEPKE